jgi:F-type H+-transporting ATPase subunit delta
VVSQQSSRELIADRYASALYELSAETKCVDEVLKDLLMIQYYIKHNNDLKLLIKSPLISSNEKMNIVKKILSDHSPNILTSNFIKVISHNKRINFLPIIISRYNTINSEKRGDVIADITSAEVLTDQQKKEIKDQLRSILGEKLSLSFDINKKIIGGLIVKVGSKMIDSSLDSKINKLTIAMKGV